MQGFPEALSRSSRDDPSQVSSSRSSNDVQHELPTLAPLSHAYPHLSSSKPFVVDDFLLSRSHMSLQDLRSELRAYQAQLKEELVQLINDDYAAFISLSTDLKGEGIRLDRLQRPLGELQAEIEKSRNDLSGVQEAVRIKLAERAVLRDDKALLHLLLRLSDSIARLESLLLIAHKDQNASQTSVDLAGLGLRSLGGHSMPPPEDEGRDDRFRGGQAKHLSRVALEYTQLLYHAEKARHSACVFVDEIQWRIDRVKSTLSRDLDHLFSNTLNSLTTSEVELASITDKARWTSDLTECLKTYDALHSWEDAEEVVRRELVQPFVKSNIFAGALNVAPSPILVRTGLPNRSDLLSPRTPFTPFTGARANPFDTLAVESLPLLAEDEDDSLAGLFNTILRFVQVNCSGVMELSDKVSAKSRKSRKNLLGGLQTQSLVTGHEGGTPGLESEGRSQQGFEIMANVVWAEVANAIMAELGNVVFSAGNPDEFQKNYTRSNNFIKSLEHLAPSFHAVESMRAHPSYTAFQRRWQLPVYFQLRWKDIVGALEETLAHPGKGSKSDGFVSVQASSFYNAMQTVWSGKVYIPELSHRFWGLTLQLLSRYRTWLLANLPAREQTNSVPSDLNATGSSNPLARTATPLANVEGMEWSAADDVNLQRLASAFIDILAMERKTWDLWKSEIGLLISASDVNDEHAVPLEEILRRALEDLSDLLPEIAAHIVVILTRRCAEALSLVKSVLTQYRTMSKKRDPTGPSPFVPNILQPLKRFLEMENLANLVDDTARRDWATQVFDGIAARYISYLEAMKKTEESLRKYQKGKMSAASWFGSGTSRENETGKDEERIRMQVILDIDALGRDAERLGVNVEASEVYTLLKTTGAT